MTTGSDAQSVPPERLRPGRAKRGEGDRTREAILDAAESILHGTGTVDAVSVRAVAEAVGVTAPTLYRHFPDKAHLIFEVCWRHFDRLEDEVIRPALAATDEPLEALAAIARGYVRFGLDNPEHYRVMLMANADHTPELYAAQNPLETGALGTTVSLVQRALDEGTIRADAGDAVTLSWVLWSGIHGLVAAKIARPNLPGPPAELVADTYMAIMLAGILTDGVDPPGGVGA